MSAITKRGEHCTRCEKTATLTSDSWTEHSHRAPEGYLCCLHFEEYVRELFRVPDLIIGDIRRWVDYRILPSGFLTCILQDRPVSIAAGRADDTNGRMIQKIVRHMLNKEPPECWGSEEKMRAWKNQGCGS